MNNTIYRSEAILLLSRVNNKTKIKKRDKNNEFMKKYNLTENFVIDIVKALEGKHFINKIENKDKRINSDYLYVFNTTIALNNVYGIEDIIQLYVKICELKDNRIILIVSFHDKEY